MPSDRHPSATIPAFELLTSPGWADYALLDSGDGSKLEQFGAYQFVRPEPQAIWRPALAERAWDSADGVFVARGEDAGSWQFRRPIDERWPLRYGSLRFWVRPTPFRHMGVFPEQAAHWDWISERIASAGRPVQVLNLFGYTGVASLAAAAAGAHVTHVDASKKTIGWARENQELSGLADRPIRWLLDDALKFVRREVRRNARYDGFLIDPPPFGRGPKGEIWRIEEHLPQLLDECRRLCSDRPLFVVLTAYAIRFSALSMRYLLQQSMRDFGGALTAGETVLLERSAGRALSTALYARWSSQ